jgi:small-conductance mechanosensitive channel
MQVSLARWVFVSALSVLDYLTCASSCLSACSLVRTKILQYDMSVLDIANSNLSGQRVINMSRVGHSKITTTLRFKYQDVQKLPDALDKVKAEIEKSCPTLITKGKPFRAKITSFERDHVEATVDCRFELPPFGDEFWGTRQNMFLAIDRAVTSCGLEYAKSGYFLNEEK